MDFSYEQALTMLKSRDATDRSEEDVKAEIVEPVLREALGYPSECIRRENQLQAQRPDFLCQLNSGELDLFVEAKALGVNLDLRPSPSAPATRIPKIQLEKYLRKRPDSHHGVFGLLTNGEEWRVCRRIENDVVWLSSSVAETWPELQSTLEPLIHRREIHVEAKKYSTQRGMEILTDIGSANSHQELIETLSLSDLEVEHQSDLVSSVRLEHQSEHSGQLFSNNYFVTIGSPAEDGFLAVADIYDALRESYLLNDTLMVAGIGITFDTHRKNSRTCRVFMWDGTRLHTSNPFDPEFPGTRILRQLESLARWRDAEPNELVNQLNSRTVHEAFYDEIAEWFARTGTELNDLRHLIRILFSWFLKEHGVIPDELFEKHTGIDVHEQLEHLFTQTLSMEPSRRKVSGRLKPLRSAFIAAPFLNGSLFNDDPNLLRTKLMDIHYIQGGEFESGLFTILKRYEWTLTEHDDVRSDTALDPSMIGSIFERFIALAHNITPSPLARQPDGTYYTPKDVTDEMVCDALAHDLTENAGGGGKRQL